jgi:hypothetical protein
LPLEYSAGAACAPHGPQRVGGAEQVAPVVAVVRIYVDRPLVRVTDGKVVFMAHEYGKPKATVRFAMTRVLVLVIIVGAAEEVRHARGERGGRNSESEVC